ncbi:uncharacterized protein EAE97_005781 [Botrytis byssoidea]|uniref:Uncharacterized protein n=1 Tax=Botrytis byssoidea TaxID=139641 RepID=A0A9P5ISA5_9HELO|nr:uncharacterized protein EAE97_005781 [Botrytis byssoidea]KAF7943711.1 hypothetical protein EAE97_005781 [Botrytis byssoidea]
MSYYNRIFIKSILKYLLLFDFWNIYLILSILLLDSKKEIIKCLILEVLYTYRYFIYYKSDSNITMKKRLLLETII